MIIAAGGCVGTALLLILNLRVQAALGEIRTEAAKSAGGMAIDLKNVELQMAHLRTEAAEDRARLYEKIMNNMDRTFMNKDAGLEMHKQNTIRLDSIDRTLTELSKRVDDIG